MQVHRHRRRGALHLRRARALKTRASALAFVPLFPFSVGLLFYARCALRLALALFAHCFGEKREKDGKFYRERRGYKPRRVCVMARRAMRNIQESNFESDASRVMYSCMRDDERGVWK